MAGVVVRDSLRMTGIREVDYIEKSYSFDGGIGRFGMRFGLGAVAG